MAMKSSDFFRLEKPIKNSVNNSVDVYEFHSVVNGNCYIARHEEYYSSLREKVIEGYHYKPRDCTRAEGNAEYKRLKSKGYRFTGKYEMDILGYKTKEKVSL